MERIIFRGIVFILLLAGATSCTETDDCVGCGLNPKILVNFSALDTKSFVDSIYTTSIDGLEVLRDSLNKEISSEQRSMINEAINSFIEDSAKWVEEYELFRSGRSRIDLIEAPGSLGLEQLQDTTIREFGLPVNMSSDTTVFYIHYHGLVDTVQFEYRRDIIQTLDGVRMRITNININNQISTFDSLRLECENRACSNDKTTLYIYF